MRPEKQAMVREVRERLEHAAYVIVVDYRGLTAQQMALLRERLATCGSRLQVVGNAVFRHAARLLGWEESFLRLMEGPLAMVVGSGDMGEAARILRVAREEFRLPVFRGGRLSGCVLTATEVEQVALLPPRRELLAKMLGSIAAPMTGLAGVLHGVLLRFLRVLKAAEDKKRTAGAVGS